MPVVRDENSRYFVSQKEFPEPYFFPYASGGGYVFSGTLLPLLSMAAETSPLFPNEDALIGSLMRRAGVKPTDNTKFLPLVFCRHPDKARQENVCGISAQTNCCTWREREASNSNAFQQCFAESSIFVLFVFAEQLQLRGNAE